MDVERAMEFILESQARTTANLEALAERMNQAEARATRTDARLDRAIRLAVQEARNERKRRQEMDARWDEKMTQLAAAQLITEEKAQQLEESVRNLDESFGKLNESFGKLNDTFRRFLESQDGGGNGSH
jgi:hypothetical protein